MTTSSDPSNELRDDTTATAPAPEAAAPDPDTSLCPACKKSHTLGDAAAKKGLAQSTARLAKLVKGLDAAGWKKSYGPGKWSIRQIVAHLRDCEMNYSVRWRKMIAEPDATLTPFDQDLWASGTAYAKQDGRQAIATWAALRAANLEMLKLAGKGALTRVGRHPEYGEINVGQLLRHVLAHDDNHFGQIEQARARGKVKKKVARARR